MRETCVTSYSNLEVTAEWTQFATQFAGAPARLMPDARARAAYVKRHLHKLGERPIHVLC
jgi:hypothetical protein